MGHQGHLLIKKREHLSRKPDKNVDQVQVPHTAELAVTDHFDSGNLMWFQSREGIFNQILAALQDDSISRVGLYGMAGSGKTNLAKQVGKRVKELSVFNRVVVVHVAAIPNVKRIQGDIADQLGLRLGGEADLAARRTQLTLRLRNEERVLIILDDLWGRLDLQEIGISNDVSHMGCKLLLTSRSRELGYVMRCQLSLPLYLLTDDEAWQLMMKRAGIHDVSPDLISAAREVTKHCRGSPLAISVIGSPLRGKTVDQWMQALTTLQRTESEVMMLREAVLRTLQVGFDGLSSEVVKTIFSICCLFPAGDKIPIEDLSQYGIRLGLYCKNELRVVIDALKDSSLLMHSDTSKDHVIMHDLVRYCGRIIVSAENPMYRGSILEYMKALYRDEEGFQWREELDRLLRQLYGVTEPPSSSTSNATFHGGEGRELQVVRSYSYTKAAATIPKPSGKLVNFKGQCRVDKSFLPLLKEACDKNPQLIESQWRHSEVLRQIAFGWLGGLLFLLHNVRIRDWVYHKQELQMFWKQAQLMEFDLEWLSPTVEGVFSSSEIAEIEALREKEKSLNEKAAKLREQLKIIEDETKVVRIEIALRESKLKGFAIADVPKAQVVSKFTFFWSKILSRR